jgi:Protein of unknown function (DUF2961)
MVNPLATLRREKLRLEKVENASVPPNTERTLFDRSGPGVVISLWMALGGGNAPALDGRLRVYYDGAPSASIDIDMGTLLATHWGAGSASTSHSCEHVHVEINSENYDTAFLLTFPIPFGTSIRIAYFNINAGQTANIYSMVAYSLTPTDEANGQRLRYKGVRYADQKVTRTASSTTTLAQITGGPGSIVYHSYVGGVGATNLSWLERNFSITVDGEPSPQIVATGTEDWFDSGWYFNGRRDYNTSFHSYVGTNRPASNVNVVGMATDLWSKWGGVPFTTSAVVRSLTEAGCTTGDTLCWCVLYYQ